MAELRAPGSAAGQQAALVPLGPTRDHAGGQPVPHPKVMVSGLGSLCYPIAEFASSILLALLLPLLLIGSASAQTPEAPSVEVVAISPEPGSVVTRDSTIEAALCYDLSTAAKGRYSIAVQFATDVLGETYSYLGTTGPLSLAVGNLTISYPLSFVWEDKGLSKPILVHFYLLKDTGPSGFALVASSESIAYRVRPEEQTHPEYQRLTDCTVEAASHLRWPVPNIPASLAARALEAASRWASAHCYLPCEYQMCGAIRLYGNGAITVHISMAASWNGGYALLVSPGAEVSLDENTLLPLDAEFGHSPCALASALCGRNRS